MMGSPTKAENPERSRGQDSKSFAVSGCKQLRATRDFRMECRNSLSRAGWSQKPRAIAAVRKVQAVGHQNVKMAFLAAR